MIQGDRILWQRTALAVGISFLLSRWSLSGLFFTVPLMTLAPRYSDKGAKALVPVGIVAFLVVAYGLFQSRQGLAEPVGRIMFLVGMFIPVVLLVACAVWILMDGRRLLVRYLASVAFGVVASLLLVSWFSGGSENVRAVDTAMLASFKTLFGDLERAGIGSAGNAGSLLPTAGDTEGLYRMVVKVLGAILAPFCMVACGLASFIALGIASRGSSDFGHRAARWKLPDDFVWGFLGCWLLVFLAVVFKANYLVRAMFVNLALGCGVLYAIQGMSIVLNFVQRKGLPISAGRLFGFLFLLLLLLPGLNMLVVVVLPLLGVTETWITYRKNV